MPILEKIMCFYSGVETPGDSSRVPPKKFTLAALSDTDGIIDPQTGDYITARALRSAVAGDISCVDPFGNITVETVAAGELLRGLCNAVRATGTTVLASNITVYT